MKVGTTVRLKQPVIQGQVVRCRTNDGTGELEALVMCQEGDATVEHWFEIDQLEKVETVEEDAQ